MLSKISSEIFKILVHQDSIITVKQLAPMLEISERSVSSYMKEVASYCEKRGYRLVRKRGKGIYLDEELRKEKIMEELEESIIPYETRSSRVEYIICTLIENCMPYTIALLADDLYVSKNTITTDIEKANALLKDEDVKIEKNAGKGIQIIGDEFTLRKILVHFYKKKKAQKCISQDSVDYRISSDEYQRVCNCYGKTCVDRVIKCISCLEKEIQYEFNDSSFVMLVEYISNQMTRIKKECFLEKSMINRLTLAEEITGWADSLTSLLNNEFCTNINPREGLYLYILLLGAEIQNSSRIVEKKLLIEEEIDIDSFANQMIQYISTIVGKNFKEDILLKSSIRLFLNSSFVRVKFGFEIQNPFLEEIKKTYPAIFSACFTASKVYENITGKSADENEISYLSILFAGAMIKNVKKVNTVIIGYGGVGIAQIVARKIEKKLPEINVVSILPENGIKEIKKGQYDLIISTIPNIKTIGETIVYITPLVDLQDIYHIKTACKKLESSRKGTEESMTLGQLLCDDFIFLSDHSKNQEGVLKKVCKKLKEQEYVEPGFYEDVIRREKVSSSALGGGIAVPHGMANLVKKPMVAIIQLESPIEWGDETADVIFLLALNFEDIKQTRIFFGSFYEMTMERDSLVHIRNAKTKTEIKQIIRGESENCS